jgi:flavin reductase (DIM6/NTAB) family NADH-FMN oxidoreductase RutF
MSSKGAAGRPREADRERGGSGSGEGEQAGEAAAAGWPREADHERGGSGSGGGDEAGEAVTGGGLEGEASAAAGEAAHAARRRGNISSNEFRRACGRFATGVTVASVLDVDGTPHGLTVSSFTSVSLEPPLVLICLGHAVTSIDVFRQSRYFGINVLAEDQSGLSDRFATKGFDRFDGLAWERGDHGVPLLTEALANIECALVRRVTAGDHDIFIGEMLRARVRDGEPLIYFAGRYRNLK